MYVNINITKISRNMIWTDSAVYHECMIIQHKLYALCFHNNINKNISLWTKIQV